MNKQASILFIQTSIGGDSAGRQDALGQQRYYQELVYASLVRSNYKVERVQMLGRQLAEIARQACLTKQMSVVEQASEMMLALPIADQFESIARYYQALCLWDKGHKDKAGKSLERAVEEVPREYKARALRAVGSAYHLRGQIDEALPFYVAAGKAAAHYDLLELAKSQQMTAVIRSIHGDHKQALADLENLFPLIRTLGKRYPATYYNFLNALAVELAEVGRLNEARSVCSITLTSPLAVAYPEWSETRDEIEAKRASATPSIIAINRAPQAASPQAQRKPKPLRALAFSWTARAKDSVQRSLVPKAEVTAIGRSKITQHLTTWMRTCVGPRAPPTPSRN